MRRWLIRDGEGRSGEGMNMTSLPRRLEIKATSYSGEVRVGVPWFRGDNEGGECVDHVAVCDRADVGSLETCAYYERLTRITLWFMVM